MEHEPVLLGTMTDLTLAQADAQCTALLDAPLVSRLPLYTGEHEAWKRWSFKISGHVNQNAPSLSAVLDSIVARLDLVEHQLMSQPEVALDRGPLLPTDVAPSRAGG